MIKFKTINKFADESGYSPHAIRTKISRGIWVENSVWIKAPDNRILISIDGFNEWAESSHISHNKFPNLRTVTGGPSPLVLED